MIPVRILCRDINLNKDTLMADNAKEAYKDANSFRITRKSHTVFHST